MQQYQHENFIKKAESGTINEIEMIKFIDSQTKEEVDALFDSINRVISNQVSGALVGYYQNEPEVNYNKEGQVVVSRTLLSKEDKLSLDKAVQDGIAPHIYGARQLEGEWILQLPGLELARRLIEVRRRGTQAPPKRPVFLTERGEKAFDDAITHGLIDKDTYAWLLDKTALSLWVYDMNRVNGVVSDLSFGKSFSWAPFENYFRITKNTLGKKYQKSNFNHTCPGYDKVKSVLFPELTWP